MTCRRTTGARAVVAVIGVVAGLAWGLGVMPPAGAQTDRDVDRASVAVLPAEIDPDAPNAGTWFTLELLPGESTSADARIVNPRTSPVTVTLSLRALDFDDGVTVTEDTSAPVASWGAFEQREVTVPARGQVTATFTVTVPEGTPPGDHIGAVVADVVDEQAAATVVQRVATRLYVTVPGEAFRALEILDVRTELDSPLFPENALVVVEVANRGDIRLRPEVRVGDQLAEGPEALMSRSTELWFADLDPPALVGLLRIPVTAVDETGLVRRVNATTTVVQWGYVLAALLVLVSGWLVARWWRNHESRTARLEADIRRLERLVAGMGGAGGLEELRTAQEMRADLSDEGDLGVAMKRARRTRDHEGFARLALRLHEKKGGNALDTLLEALAHGTTYEDDLFEAAASYGEEAIAEHNRTAKLPDDLRIALLAEAGKTE